MTSLVRTFQTRVPDHPAIGRMADYLSRKERQLFKAYAAGAADQNASVTEASRINALKRKFIQDGLTARHFNSLRASLDGKIRSIRELAKTRETELKQRLRQKQAKISKAEKSLIEISTGPRRDKILAGLHQSKRRLAILQNRAVAAGEQAKGKIVSLCFGSKKLFNAQHHLAENGFKDHAEWQNQWRTARASQFFLVGSKDETSGNQLCQIDMAQDGTFTLKIRLPNGLIDPVNPKAKYIVLTDIAFSHGRKEILAALAAKQALTYRFVKDVAFSERKYLKSPWRVFVSLSEEIRQKPVDEFAGAVGVDLNEDHIAAVRIDRHGNPVAQMSLPLCLYGLSQDQAKAKIELAAKRVADWAGAHRVSVVAENLDFAKKKQTLANEANVKRARMLSSFVYSKFLSTLERRTIRNGLKFVSVNPAYTSLIGRCKFAKRYGLSVHLSAAAAIARRSMKFSERPSGLADVPIGKSLHVTLDRPDRIGRRHVWKTWAKIGHALKAVLAAPVSSGRKAGSSVARKSKGLPAMDGSLREDAVFLEAFTRPSTVKSRDAGQQSCSADELDVVSA